MTVSTLRTESTDERTIVSRLRAIRLVPVIVIDDPRSAPALGRALADGGLPCAEVTFRTAGAREALARLTDECPDVLAGAGTNRADFTGDATTAAPALALALTRVR